VNEILGMRMSSVAIFAGSEVTTTPWDSIAYIVITFRVSRRPREMYCGHARPCVCLCVCLSDRGRMPTLLHGPGCNLGER